MAIIFTKHAMRRLEERYFRRALVEETISSPDKTTAGKHADTLELNKRFGSKQVTAIIKRVEDGQTLVLSCWIDPPYEGTKDFRKKKRYETYQKAGFWRRVWMDIVSLFTGF